MKIQPPPRIGLAQLPTPLERFPLSPSPGLNVEIFIKRDDLTGSILSGNKVRKLEFLFYDIMASRCDTVITCGGVQSNHCRAVAALCATAGLGCLLILKGKEAKNPEGNYFLSKLFGARMKFVTDKEYETDIDGIMRKVASRLKARGKKTYVIPEGGSDPLGVWGYIKALEEIRGQVDKAGIKIDTIVTAVGSGGTYAGLYIGSKLIGWDVKILGFAVSRDALYFQKRIFDICIGFQGQAQLDLGLSPEEIEIDDRFIGPGYAKIGLVEIEFIKNIAANSGIVLDPAYTSKVLLGLFTTIEGGKFKAGSNIIFIHTGGSWGLLPFGSIIFHK
jgi:D-cysteine desulfhydrase